MPLGAKKRQPRPHPMSADVLHYLEFKLVSERDAIIENNGALRMLPKSVICPIGVIKEVTSRSKSIECVEDMRLFPCLRPEFRISHTFFNENVYLYIVLDQQNVHVPGLRFLCMMYVLYMIIVLLSS